MRATYYFVITCVLFLASTVGYGQHSNVTFGLQYKPILPFKILNVDDVLLSENGLDATISPQLGYNFGAVIRWELLEKLSLETGLNYNKRNFKIDATLDDTLSSSMSFGIVTYEVPIQALFYVKLSDKFYMNVASGFSVNFRASNVGKISDDFNFSQTTNIQNINLAYVANIGFEYRSKKSGYFYLGASLTNPFRLLGKIEIVSRVPLNHKTVSGDLSGNYISLDFRYFFQDSKKNQKKER